MNATHNIYDVSITNIITDVSIQGGEITPMQEEEAYISITDLEIRLVEITNTNDCVSVNGSTISSMQAGTQFTWDVESNDG